MSQEFRPVNTVAESVRTACLAELDALKPGNVSVYSSGHGMNVEDFTKSAACIANELAAQGLSVGERVLNAVQATREAVGCNTNLGIVLLCAPLAHAALERAPQQTFRQSLGRTLYRLDDNDTAFVFRAIRLADPGGLGRSERFDVMGAADVSLMEVMQEAEDRDRIAYQYSHEFADVFDFGLELLDEGLERWSSPAWATTRLYLSFLASFPDTHIRRKLGDKIAEEIRKSGEKLLSLFEAARQPQELVEQLFAFDLRLKERDINPGTSADLTVATLLAKDLEIECAKVAADCRTFA